MATAPHTLVSIVLPTFNRESFLAQAFSSIAAQEYPHWELIVVDDGSTDGTAAEVQRLIPTMPGPVKYVRQDNRGAYGARNTGCRHATGDYISFFDSDDLWFPHHLRRCVEALDAHADLDW